MQFDEIRNSKVGISTVFLKDNISKVTNVLHHAVEEFAKRANKKGQFLNWVDLPEVQIERINEIYDSVDKLKNQTDAKFLTVLGIGGSKHTVEHMLSINGLNIGNNLIKFYSDIDSISENRYLASIGNDITNSNFLVASKSGSTFETKDALLRFRNRLIDAYKANGHLQKDAQSLADKHFVAVTDADEKISQLRQMSNENNWPGKLLIHDDVGGRFSALDDHALFTLAYAEMKKSDMIEMLNGAKEMTAIALNSDIKENMPLLQAAFWASEKLNNITSSVHQYLGSVFENTVNWHTQMQNESVKDTSKQIAKIPDAMHHSAEAHFNPANKLVFALTVPNDHGECRENAESYIDALCKSYEVTGAFFTEKVETEGMGLTPEAAGAMTQLRAYATVYQEIVEKITKGIDFPEVLDSVLQPHVEFYKKNLKGGVVVPGRISK